MKKIAFYCLLCALFAGNLSAQVVSDPDQVRDLSLSFKTSVGYTSGAYGDMPFGFGVGFEAEYFHNQKWLIFASAQNLSTVDFLEYDYYSFFKNNGYFDLAGGLSLFGFEKSKNRSKKAAIKRGSYGVDTLYWVENDINDITKHNILVRGGIHIKGNSIYDYRYSDLSEGINLIDYGMREIMNDNYRVTSPFLGVEYRFTKGYSYILRRDYYGAAQHFSIFADVFLTSFLDDNVELNDRTASGTFYPGIISEDNSGELMLDKFGFRIGFKALTQHYKSAGLGWSIELVSQPDVITRAGSGNTIFMYTLLITL
jgi:hypothetical protein